MGMMEGIINDAKALEAEAIRAEEDSQKAYEEFVKESNLSMDAKNKDLVNKHQVKGETEAEKVEAETARDTVMGELEELSAAKNKDLVNKNQVKGETEAEKVD